MKQFFGKKITNELFKIIIYFLKNRWRKSAIQRNSKSLFRLAFCYFQGIGVEGILKERFLLWKIFS